MAKVEATVEELVCMIERGELRLPEMQRRYVWRSTRVRDLLDSLYRGYPSGAILLWETDEKEVPLQDMAVKQSDNPYASTRLLLDGQQRLTSLAAVIRGKLVTVGGRKRPIELLFNLEHPDELSVVTEVYEGGSDDENGDEGIEDEADSTEDELQERFNRMTFVVATKKLARLPHWVNVSEVFKEDNDALFLKQAGVETLEDPNYKRYADRLARLRAIRKYSYRMDVLERSLSYDEVTEIFVRVNSLGAKLRSSDLALAQITAKWRNSLKDFQTFQQDCNRTGFALDLGSVHLRSLVAFATGQSRFLTVGGLSLDALQVGWKESRRGMEFALNFMRSNAKIESPALLASPFILITVAYYGHKRDYSLSPDESEQLRRWVLLVNAKGRYSRGSSETILDQDLAILREGKGTNELTERLRQQVGNLQVTPQELEGRNQRSALFKTMFLAFRAAGAKDWRSNLAIAINHKGTQHKLQFHHIFPKAVLKGIYSVREADDIANLCFISGKTNQQIKDKSPQTYFPDLIKKVGTEPFMAQCIPTDTNLLDPEAYKAFLVERRKQIAIRLNEFLQDAH
ncbi:MAG: DUF262 domain-containing protein [Nitrospira sp.]|nr:DUF262 domain-containing protein [Nitrospira sp.]MDE0403725.1 DUF262 domain-containing protein [Nitrospira sp.]